MRWREPAASAEQDESCTSLQNYIADARACMTCQLMAIQNCSVQKGSRTRLSSEQTQAVSPFVACTAVRTSLGETDIYQKTGILLVLKPGYTTIKNRRRQRKRLSHQQGSHERREPARLCKSPLLKNNKNQRACMFLVSSLPNGKP